MFRVRPKPKILTLDELKCCGVIEFEWPWGPEKIPPSTTTDNGDGTVTTEWVSESHSGVPNDGGKMFLTLCCGDYLRLDFEDRDLSGDGNWNVYIKALDTIDEQHDYTFPPDGTTANVHDDWTTRQPPYSLDLYPESAFPISACGMSIEMWWEGGVTFSITYGKAP